MVSSGETLASRFRDLSGQLEALRSGLNEQVTSSVSVINSSASQIAELNNQISLASSASHSPPSDLLDQRDALLRDLSKEIRVSSAPMGNGSISVALSNGQPLVLGGVTFPIAAQFNPADGINMAVGTKNASGTFQPFGETMLSGGTLGGVMAFRNQTLDVAENSLGRVAGALATALNAQHAVGQDRNGAPGGALFSFNGGLVLANAHNTGTAVVAATVTNYDAVTTSDYRVDFDGTNYMVRRLSDNNVQTFASLPQSIDGFTLALGSGAPAAGDSFTVMPTRSAAASLTALIADPAKIAAGLPVRASASAANTGVASLRVDSVAPPAGANLTQPVSITFTSATTFDVSGSGTGNPTGLVYSPGMKVSYNGWSATLDGTPKGGDVFNVATNVNGSGDNGNLLALSALGNTRLIGGGTLSAGDAYAQVVSNVGNQARAAAMGAKAQDAVLTQAQTAQQEVSGVNLDEEAANLLKYQQAYQAAGRVIATANSLFDDIIAIMR
jgi:flagellar hook-associated protein 1 FlgK